MKPRPARSFEVCYDLSGTGEPMVLLFTSGSMSPKRIISLSEAERRGIVPKEKANQAKKEARRIRKLLAQPKCRG